LEIKKLIEENNSLEFLVKGTNKAFINSIRRTAMNAVPILAAEDITIYENSSILFDEFLAQRIAMVPIKTDAKRFKKGEKTKLILEKEGPGTVYSKDIQATDPKIEVVFDNIPLVKLKEEQKIKLEIDAVMGTGKQHAKWQPANLTFRNTVELLNKTKNEQLMKRIVESCPKEILEIKAKKIVLKDPLKCDLCRKCEETSKGELEIGFDEKTFIVTVENHGNLKSKEVITSTINVLNEKMEEMKKELKKL
jgi:DNA-directed RNA polymerase subunit D